MGQVTALGTGWSSMAGTGTFLATGKAGRNGSVSIWNVSTPGAPSQVFSLPDNGTPTVALWKAGGSYYLAKLDTTGKILSIYNVSCIRPGAAPVRLRRSGRGRSARP